MAAAVNTVFGILLALALISPLLEAARFGSRAKTLHLRSDKGNGDLGEGYVRIRRSEGLKFPVEEKLTLNREARSAKNGDRLGDEHDKAKVTKFDLNDNHPELIVHWAGENSDMIVCLTRDIDQTEISTSNVYFSYDYGKNFEEKSSLHLVNGTKPIFDRFYHSPANNMRYLFVDVINQQVFSTTNGGRSFINFPSPAKMTTITMHQTDQDIVLGMDDSDHTKGLWKSDDFGVSWILIQSDVKSFWWGDPAYDKPDTLFVERIEATGKSTVIMSENYFGYEDFEQMLIGSVIDFELQGKYMFATKDASGPIPIDRRQARQASDRPRLDLYVSHNRGPFIRANFPTELDKLDFYIADADEDQAFVCVNHDSLKTNLYISEADGIRYSLSLEDIVYYSPEGPGKDTWLSRFADEAFVDLHEVEGLRGIYIASQFNTTDGDFVESNMVSLITFDKGGEWNLLDPPRFEEGDCVPPLCSLHLSQKFSQYYPGSRLVPILSKKSAPGIIIGTGTMGTTLGSSETFDVFKSSSAGATWYKVLMDPHFFSLGDHGGVLTAVSQYGSTNEVKYSVTEGETWTTEEFNDEKIVIYGMMTEPGEKTTTFTVFGSLTAEHSWLIVQIDMKDALGPDCTQDDYKTWWPGEEFHDSHCLLGRKMVFERRIAHAVCFNGQDYDRPISVENCTCEREDFECDFGYKERNDWQTACIPDSESPIDPHQIPVPCPEGTFYRRTKGYRKVEGDTCNGGEEYRYEADKVTCPIKEMPEFILYARRTEIHRFLLNNNHDERLNLGLDLQAAIAVDFDWHNNCLYWADIVEDTIHKYCLDNGNHTLIVNKNLETVEGLAFDWLAMNIYWVDSGLNKIEVARHDGRFRRTLVNETLDKPRAIALDPKKGIMYWTDWGSIPHIRIGHMDGTNLRFLISDNIHWPNGIAIDDQTQKLYWTDAYLDRIEMSELDGSHRRVLLSENIPHPYAIGVYKNDIYWDDWSQEAILKANKYSGQQREIVMGNLSGIMDLKVFHNASQQGDNPCKINNGGCTHLCLAVPAALGAPGAPGISRNCLCPDDFRKEIKPDGSENCICDHGETLMPNGDCKRTGSTCEPDQFACSNMNCIPLLWKCDRDNDCGDMSDEMNCPYEECHIDEFKCANTGHCIPLNWRCDGDNDCGDRSDEPDTCSFPTCRPGEFSCANKRCIPNSWICDEDDDCHDGSDEENCPTTELPTSTVYPGTCSSQQFQCTNGHCIPSGWKCDGDNDCGDMSDEPPTCGHRICNPFQFRCDNGTCIPAYWKCDGMEDCRDGSDELSCPTSMTTPSSTTWWFPDGSCHPGDFHCWNGQCVFSSWKCDGIVDCSDGSDEYDCMTDEPTISPDNTCDTYQFLCPYGGCIPQSWVCDHENDCGDWADEQGCYPSTTPASGQTTCSFWEVPCGPGARVRCIASSWVCDGDNDCGDWSDERNCPTDLPTEPPIVISTVSYCPPNTFMCGNREKCIPQAYRCNGFHDCVDNSDERDCFSTTVAPTPCSGFQCLLGQMCLPISKKCDGVIDCYDGTDENNCHTDTYVVSSFTARANSFSIVQVIWTQPTIRPTETYKFHIYKRQLSGEFINIDKIVESSTTEYLWTRLIPGALYEFSINVRVGSIDYQKWDYIPVQMPEIVPGSPQHLEVLLHGMFAVQVSWSPPSASMGITGYQVYYIVVNGWLWTEHQIKQVGPQTTSTIIENLQRFTEYGFKVAAVNSAGLGTWTPLVNITTSSNPGLVIYTAPTDFVMGDTLENTAHMSWKKPETRASVLFYLIHCGKSSTSLAQSLLCGNTTDTKITIDKLCPGTKYYFTVEAANRVSVGPPSDRRTATTIGNALTAPTNLTATSMSIDSIQLSWDYQQSNRQLNDFAIYYDTSGETALPRRQTTTSNPYLVTNLAFGVTYLFQVSLNTDSCADVPRSNIVSGSTNYDVTAPCRLLMKMSSDLTTITIKWKSPRDRPQTLNYKVTYQECLGAAKFGPISTKKTGFTKATDLNMAITGLVPGASYLINVSSDVDRAESVGIKAATNVPSAPTELHAVMEQGNFVALSWQKSPNPFNESLGYTVFMSNVSNYPVPIINRKRRQAPSCEELNTLKNMTAYVPIGNTTKHFYRVKQLPAQKTFLFRVSTTAYKGHYGDMSAVACVVTLGGVKPTAKPYGPPANQPTWIAGIGAAGALILLLAVFLVFFIVRHRRLQRSFMSFANSHYDPQSGIATFSNDDNDLGDEEDQPMIRGFSDDEPLVVA